MRCKSLVLITYAIIVALALVGCSVAASSGTTPAAMSTPSIAPASRGRAADQTMSGYPLPPKSGDQALGSVALDSLTEDQVAALYDAVESLTINVYERVSPSVVNITSRVIQMDYFGTVYPSEGTGSGFVVDKLGHIVTNYHVIEQADTVQVTLLDDTVVEAEVIGADPLNDLAVIRVSVPASKLFPVDMSYQGEIRVGQRAIAIGSPFGLGWTLTEGVISSVGRPLRLSREREIYDVIQTDAAINPGNSGGPLLNSRGQLIGVNTAIQSGAENIGFAVPLATVRRVVPELISSGRYAHPWLGISGYSIFPELARRFDLPAEQGILIAGVGPGGPAAKAGLRGGTREVILGNLRLWTGGDMIVDIDGTPIGDNSELSEFLETQTRVGETVTVQFYRGQDMLTTELTIGERFER